MLTFQELLMIAVEPNFLFKHIKTMQTKYERARELESKQEERSTEYLQLSIEIDEFKNTWISNINQLILTLHNIKHQDGIKMISASPLMREFFQYCDVYSLGLIAFHSDSNYQRKWATLFCPPEYSKEKMPHHIDNNLKF